MKTLYHIVKRDELDAVLKTDEYKPKSLHTEGFIHLAYEEQLNTILRKFFTGSTDVFLLELDSRKLAHDVIVEAALDSEHATTFYPHLYGPLNAKAITKVHKLQIDQKGDIQPVENLPT